MGIQIEKEIEARREMEKEIEKRIAVHQERQREREMAVKSISYSLSTKKFKSNIFLKLANL